MTGWPGSVPWSGRVTWPLAAVPLQVSAGSHSPWAAPPGLASHEQPSPCSKGWAAYSQFRGRPLAPLLEAHEHSPGLLMKSWTVTPGWKVIPTWPHLLLPPGPAPCPACPTPNLAHPSRPHSRALLAFQFLEAWCPGPGLSAHHSKARLPSSMG